MPKDMVEIVLERALAIEAEHDGDSNWLGWTWDQVQANPNFLNRLATGENPVVTVTYRSHSCTNYRINKKVIEEIEQAVGEDRYAVPDDIFDVIVGCDKVKTILHRALASPKPVHVLLAGPPATAKSLFLGELNRIGGSRFALGGSSSKAGILDFLIEAQPRYLILDEMDKMPTIELSVLLSLMESGRVTRLKWGKTEIVDLTTWVFAGANQIGKIPQELLSRFVRLVVPAYSDADFKSVVYSVLTKREGCEPEVATYISNKLLGRTRDVRDAVKVGRMAHGVQDVDEVVGVLFP